MIKLFAPLVHLAKLLALRSMAKDSLLSKGLVWHKFDFWKVISEAFGRLLLSLNRQTVFLNLIVCNVPKFRSRVSEVTKDDSKVLIGFFLKGLRQSI